MILYKTLYKCKDIDLKDIGLWLIELDVIENI